MDFDLSFVGEDWDAESSSTPLTGELRLLFALIS